MKFVYSRFDDDMTCHVDRMILRKQYHNMKLELNMYVCNQSCTYWVLDEIHNKKMMTESNGSAGNIMT